MAYSPEDDKFIFDLPVEKYPDKNLGFINRDRNESSQPPIMDVFVPYEADGYVTRIIDTRAFDQDSKPQRYDFVKPRSSQYENLRHIETRSFFSNHTAFHERYDGEHLDFMTSLMSQRALDAMAERLRIRRAVERIEGSTMRVIDDAEEPYERLDGTVQFIGFVANTGVRVEGATRDDFIALGLELQNQKDAEVALENARNIPLMGGEYFA